jgi:hypothetical protein
MKTARKLLLLLIVAIIAIVSIFIYYQLHHIFLKRMIISSFTGIGTLHQENIGNILIVISDTIIVDTAEYQITIRIDSAVSTYFRTKLQIGACNGSADEINSKIVGACSNFRVVEDKKDNYTKYDKNGIVVQYPHNRFLLTYGVRCNKFRNLTQHEINQNLEYLHNIKGLIE